MGQFKPMVKMMTTEPTVELKLKKGGTVKGHKCMKDGGDATGHKGMANGGIPAGLMGGAMGAPMVPARGRRMAAPPVGRPSMAARRAAMKAAQMGARGGMKKGGESDALAKHAAQPASKAHKGLKTGGVAKGNAGGYKTGGVVMGQGGYKDGGIIKCKEGTSKVSTATVNRSPAKTGDVKLGNNGGYKKGGLAACGTSAKKFASGGSVNDAGKAQKMPAKKKSPPVAINMLSGTFKKGGKVSSKELQAIFKKENAPAMKAAKADSNEKYKKGGKVKKMARGGLPDLGNRPLPVPTRQATGLGRRPDIPKYVPEVASNPVPIVKSPRGRMPSPPPTSPRGGWCGTDLVNSKRFPQFGDGVDMPPASTSSGQGVAPPSPPEYTMARMKKGGYASGGTMSDMEASPEEQLREMRRQKAETKGYESVAKSDTEANEQMLDMISSLPRSVKNLYRKAKSALTGPGAVTDTERTISRTVAPAKKSGGRAKK